LLLFLSWSIKCKYATLITVVLGKFLMVFKNIWKVENNAEEWLKDRDCDFDCECECECECEWVRVGCLFTWQVDCNRIRCRHQKEIMYAIWEILWKWIFSLTIVLDNNTRDLILPMTLMTRIQKVQSIAVRLNVCLLLLTIFFNDQRPFIFWLKNMNYHLEVKKDVCTVPEKLCEEWIDREKHFQHKVSLYLDIISGFQLSVNYRSSSSSRQVSPNAMTSYLQQTQSC
jgi:hypothetical protein